MPFFLRGCLAKKLDLGAALGLEQTNVHLAIAWWTRRGNASLRHRELQAKPVPFAIRGGCGE
jgi:hypothetical protein